MTHQADKSENDHHTRIAVLNAQRKAKQAACTAPCGGSGKSGRRPPHKTTEAQKRILLAEFARNPSPQAKERERIARALNVERRIVKNWFSNQRAFRRKTGQGYPGCSFGRESSGSRSSCRSDDEWEREDGPKNQDNLPCERAATHEMDTESDADDVKAPPAPVHPVLRTTTNACHPLTITAHQNDMPVKKPHLALAHGSDPLSGVGVPDPTLASTLNVPSQSLIYHHSLPPIPRRAFYTPCVLPIMPPRLYDLPLSSNRYPESALRSSLPQSAGVVFVS